MGNYRLIPYHFFQNKGLNYVSKLITLILTAFFLRPNVIHAQFSQYGVVLMLAKKYHLIPKKIQCFFTDRDYYDSYTDKYKAVFRASANQLTNVICTTDRNMASWKENTKADNIKVIYNVLEPDWYQFDSNEKNEIREQYKLNNQFVIGFSGRFSRYKRWDKALEIVKHYEKDEKISFVFTIAAFVPEEVQEMQKFIVRIHELVGDRAIIFINVGEEKMKNFYYMLDCFILTSENESFGRTLIEAMTKQCSVIGTRLGGVPSIIDLEANLYELNQLDRVYDVINSYRSDDEYLRKDQLHFYKLVHSKFSYETFKKDFIELYQKAGLSD